MKIATLRKLKGWTQADLAHAAGTEQPTISRIEKGSESVTLRMLKDVAAALDTPLYTLFLDDFTDAEIRLLEVYRSLSDDRKKGWEDLATSVLNQHQTTD